MYCRSLSFIADPDYKYLYNLFEGCSERNGFDIRQPDFIWNKNRLQMERENLKQSMMRVLSKKKEEEAAATGAAAAAAHKKDESKNPEHNT